MIDGRTVYSPLFSGVFWNMQDYVLDDIDRIEVIRGPGGTLWGANAVNGVVNIITRNSRDTQGRCVEAGGGTRLGHCRRAPRGGTDRRRYRVYGKFRADDSMSSQPGRAGSPPATSSSAGVAFDDSDAAKPVSWTLQGTSSTAGGPHDRDDGEWTVTTCRAVGRKLVDNLAAAEFSHTTAPTGE